MSFVVIVVVVISHILRQQVFFPENYLFWSAAPGVILTNCMAVIWRHISLELSPKNPLDNTFPSPPPPITTPLQPLGDVWDHGRQEIGRKAENKLRLLNLLTLCLTPSHFVTLLTLGLPRELAPPPLDMTRPRCRGLSRPQPRFAVQGLSCFGSCHVGAGESVDAE